MSEHTPEPWESTQATENEDGTFTARVFAVASNATIATVTTRGQENAEADARLLATSPDLLKQRDALLEACGRCADVIGHNSCSDGHQPNGFVVALEHARNAIALVKSSAPVTVETNGPVTEIHVPDTRAITDEDGRKIAKAIKHLL